MFLIWLELAVCAAAICAAGVRVSRYGDIIAEKTGVGGTWIGLVLISTVTSLPELATGISAVGFADAPEIALGDILGSCVFNLVILTVVDFLYRRESVYTRASQGHILSAAFGVILIGFVGFNVLLATLGMSFALGSVGLSTPIIFLLYAVAMRTVFRYERDQRARFTEEAAERYPGVTLRHAAAGYARWALVVVVAGIALPFIGVQLSERMGWEQSFVGSLFVALATSLPEVVVTISAVRLGALDLAIGNLFGSNLFNIMILGLDDLIYRRGPLLASVSGIHAVSALSAILMTGVAIVGLLYRPKTRLFRAVGWASLILFSLYLMNAYVLFLYGSR